MTTCNRKHWYTFVLHLLFSIHRQYAWYLHTGQWPHNLSRGKRLQHSIRHFNHFLKYSALRSVMKQERKTCAVLLAITRLPKLVTRMSTLSKTWWTLQTRCQACSSWHTVSIACDEWAGHCVLYGIVNNKESILR